MPDIRQHMRILAGATATALLAGCSVIGGSSADDARTVTLLVHDSFAMDERVIADFERTSGITLDVRPVGDAGALTNQLALTADDPLGDVAYGVDSTFASRALDAGVFATHRPDAPGLDRYAATGAGGRLTPVDVGDVCVNVDPAALADRGLPEPSTLDDLADPRYRDLLVVQNPATSSPGLAFLLATVDAYGEDGWLGYWERLRANGVQVVSGWEEAYTQEFSGSSGAGPRPIVVSYASSPAAEVGDDGTPRTRALLDTCYRQVEYAGVIEGTDAPEGARAVVDFLVSQPFQAQVPDQMFVYPARSGVALPAAWATAAPLPEDPAELDPGRVQDGRERWVEQWRGLLEG